MGEGQAADSAEAGRAEVGNAAAGSTEVGHAEAETHAVGPVWFLTGLMLGLRPDAERMLTQFFADARVLWDAPVGHLDVSRASAERWHLCVDVNELEPTADTGRTVGAATGVPLGAGVGIAARANTGGRATVTVTVRRLGAGGASSEEV
ncbi:MAG: hypothetical protein OWU32_06685, partial [Firmicutes bacterium]|nr:hypothetical protein [Bacillota bacterium]